MPAPKKRISRRRVLAIAGGALLALGGGAAIVRTRGYALPPGRSPLKAFSAWHFVVISAVARRIAAPDTDDGSVPTTDDVDVAGFLDGYVSRMAEPLRRDLLRLLAFVEHVAPVMTRHASRFTKLAAPDQDKILAWLESNDQDLLRGGFDALKSLVFLGYYRDVRTWKVIGYGGPFVGRPEQGWY